MGWYFRKGFLFYIVCVWGREREGERRCQKEMDYRIKIIEEHFSCISLITYERYNEEYRTIFLAEPCSLRDLSSPTGFEPGPPALGAQSLNHWTTREGPGLFFFFFNILFIYLWLCWVFVSVWGLSPVAASGGHSSSRCAGLSLSRPLLLRSTGSRRAGSVIVAHGPSRSAACGIFPDHGSNLCPLHWQADSQPLHHQGSPRTIFNSNLGITWTIWIWSWLFNLLSLLCQLEQVI